MSYKSKPKHKTSREHRKSTRAKNLIKEVFVFTLQEVRVERGRDTTPTQYSERVPIFHFMSFLSMVQLWPFCTLMRYLNLWGADAVFTVAIRDTYTVVIVSSHVPQV